MKAPALSLGLAFTLAVATSVAGCQHKSEPVATARRCEPESAVDGELLAFLSLARSLHHQATVLETGGDVGGAADAMERLVSAPLPLGGAPRPEVHEVLADGFARLAELRLRQGKGPQAEEAVARGLEHATSPTYFRGHLLEVRGLVHEARASELADAGKAAEASRARADAVKSFGEAVAVQEKVIREATDDTSGATRNKGAATKSDSGALP